MRMRTFRIVGAALLAGSLVLACGEESEDDGGGASCPADAPANASSCSDFDAGFKCTYGNSTCTCSGITWNCMQGGGNNTTGSPTGSGGNGFGP
ncbi:MAG TPA: hypothetical protein VI197_16555 [Polyangiaceae bacterium]